MRLHIYVAHMWNMQNLLLNKIMAKWCSLLNIKQKHFCTEGNAVIKHCCVNRFLVMIRCVTCFASCCFAGFLSWFRNGLLATGIGVIAFVQSEVGREAAYGTAWIALHFVLHTWIMSDWHMGGGETRLDQRENTEFRVWNISYSYFFLKHLYFQFT